MLLSSLVNSREHVPFFIELVDNGFQKEGGEYFLFSAHLGPNKWVNDMESCQMKWRRETG